MIYVRENKVLRKEIEEELAICMRNFMLAGAVTTEQVMEEAVEMPGTSIKIETGKNNVMGVEVPTLKIVEGDKKELYPYSFATVSGELDESIAKLTELMPKLVRLAEVEKTCDMLADEIEKNRRRVNALEYVIIPQVTETIKYITMKLDENERSSTIRLMKVKSMLGGRQNQTENKE